MPLAAVLMQEMMWNGIIPIPVPLTIPPGVALKRFGVTVASPSVIQTNGNSFEGFYQLPAPIFTPLDLVQLNYLQAGSGTADGWGSLGQQAMALELLVGPGNGCVNARPLFVQASGNIIIPASASSPTVNFFLSNNYFSRVGQSIQTRSDVIATLPTPSSFSTSGTYPWTIICWIYDNGSQNGIFTSWGYGVNGAATYGKAFSLSGNQQTRLQLSLGVQFGGSVSGSDMFQATLTKFEIRQYYQSFITPNP